MITGLDFSPRTAWKVWLAALLACVAVQIYQLELPVAVVTLTVDMLIPMLMYFGLGMICGQAIHGLIVHPWVPFVAVGAVFLLWITSMMSWTMVVLGFKKHDLIVAAVSAAMLVGMYIRVIWNAIVRRWLG